MKYQFQNWTWRKNMKKRKIEDIMDKIGIPECAQGYECIVEALMLMDEPVWKNAKWMNVYEEIGRRLGKRGSSVERSIRYCFEITRKREKNQPDIEEYVASVYTGNHHTLKHFYKILKREEEDENSKY